MESVREVLRGVGTWDLVRLNCGEQLKGDYRSCQYIALDRQDTDTLEFCAGKTLSTDSLWALLGHTPQVSPRHREGGKLSGADKDRGVQINLHDQQGAVGLYDVLT